MHSVNFNSLQEKTTGSSEPVQTASTTHEGRRVIVASTKLPTAHTLEPRVFGTHKSGSTPERSIQMNDHLLNARKKMLCPIVHHSRNLKKNSTKDIGPEEQIRMKYGQPETLQCLEKNGHKQNQEVLNACDISDIPKLKKIHSAGLNITSGICTGSHEVFYPILHAAKTNNRELFLFLLDVARTTSSFKKELDKVIYLLIQCDNVEFIRLLEERKLLNDYHVIRDSPQPVPMILIAIDNDAAEVIEWLLDRNIDLTKKVKTPVYSDLVTVSSKNTFDLAVSKRDFKLLLRILLKFAGNNANTKLLPDTAWLKDLVWVFSVADFEIIIDLLKNFKNFQEITKPILASACNNIEILELLICKFSQTLVHSLENMQESQFTVMEILDTLSNKVISEYSIDHLQVLIQKSLPDPEDVNWLLDCCFKYSDSTPAYLALFKEISPATWLIRACICLGAITTIDDYHPAFVAIEGVETPCQKSLTAVTDGIDLKGSRSPQVTPERSLCKKVDEKLELFFDAVLKKLVSGDKRST